MADVTPSSLRCLLTLDQRFVAAALAASGTSGADYTQAGPTPGTPVASAGAPELQASGEQDTETVEVYTTRGGNPGAAVGLVGSAAPFVGPGIAWRQVGDVSYRGWDPPTSISEFEFVDRTTTANEWLYPHVVTRADGDSFMVVQHSERYVATYKRVRGGSWTATGVVFDAGSALYASPVRACPCLVVLPGNRLLCIWYDAASAISTSQSSDDGATWTTPQVADLYASTVILLGNPLVRMRAAYSGGQILLLLSVSVATYDTVIQLASIDDGASFSLANVVGDHDAGYAEVVAAPGGSGFVVATIETSRATTGATTPAYVRRLASAFDSFYGVTPICSQADADASEWGTQAGAPSLLTAGELALVVDDAGVLWLLGLDWDGGATRQGLISRSPDGGATWALSSRRWYDCADATRGPRQITASAQGGRLIVPHTLNASVATASLAVLYLGGPTTVCQPQQNALVTVPDYAMDYTVAWLPYATPNGTGATWALATIGATITLTGQGLRIQHTGVLDYATYSAAPTTTNSRGLHAIADMRCTAVALDLTLTIDTAALGFAAKVTVTPTTIVLADVGGAAILKTVTTTAGAAGVQIKLAIGDAVGGVGNNGRVQAWYRAWGSDSDREWIEILGLSSVLTQFVTAADAIVFGTGAGTATTDVYFRLVQYAQGTDCGVGLYLPSQTSSPSGLLGQPLGPTPYPLAETGLRVAALDGPSRAGDTWVIAPRFEHPISSVDPLTAPSPDVHWRSLADNVAQRIVFVLTEATPPEGPLGCLYLDGCNFATATWAGWDGAAWVAIATVDLRLGTTLKFARAGEIVNCGTGGGSAIADYIERNALAGCRMLLSAGLIRKIRTNSGGRWTGAAVTTTRPIVVLDEFTVGDTAAGAAAEIWSPRGATVFRAATTAYSRYSLHIPAQVTREGYYRIGVLMPGPLAVLGEPDYSRQLVSETNVETTTARGGARRKRRLGSLRRSAQVSWTDGAHGANVHDSSPDYVTDYTAGNPIATPAAIATDLHGLIAVNDVAPVVYLPVVPVPASGATVTSITAADLMLYGTIETDTLQTDVVAGEEHTGAGRGEYVRVGTVRIEEAL